MIFVAVFLLFSSCSPPQKPTTGAPAVQDESFGGGVGVSMGVSYIEEVEVQEDIEDRAKEVVVDAGVAKVVTDVAADATLEAREQAAMVQGTEDQRVAIKAVRVQRKAVRRSHRKAAKMKRGADSLQVAVRRGRLRRLEHYAKKQGWSAEKVPAGSDRDVRLQEWWQEWRQLKKMGLELR